MALTPMMSQYLLTKEQYKDCILFYRLGDFYEMFFDDAIVASKALDLVLTGKDCGLAERAPMCGIPFHAADNYISKLISQGFKVAICEQLSLPQKGKMVDRDVIRVVTPGTVFEEELLDEKSNNYIVSLSEKEGRYGVAFSDLSTGEFSTLELSGDNKDILLSDFLVRTKPVEVILPERLKESFISLAVVKKDACSKPFVYGDWAFENHNAIESLKKQYGPSCLSVFEISNMPASISACGALLEYFRETQKKNINHLQRIKKIQNSDYMVLDLNTRRNLELTETIRDRKKKGSLLNLLDSTKTSIGARLLKNWFNEPLKNEKSISERLDSVEDIQKKMMMRDELVSSLEKICDFERLASRISLGTISPRECLALALSLKNVPKLKSALSFATSKKLVNFYSTIEDFSSVSETIENCISENPPLLLKDGGFIREGFSDELDELRNAKTDGKKWLAEIEIREREETGIKNLKVSFNRVFGFFIEVNKSQIASVPLRYIRKQTVANNERYITEELKEIENKILNAEENSIKMENEIFSSLRASLQKIVPSLQNLSKIIGEVDCLTAFAIDAIKFNYVKPKVSSKIDHIKIVEGRHPVVESLLKDEQFISNDTYLNSSTDKMMIITGPNMAGKSTYMRQVAVITFMAHIGCFVPAKSAEISLTDRIFTRVGASDDLSFGQSTFMVEMSEVSNILANATDKSLIILDEIGRGTSTFDGLAIAWAVVEEIVKNYSAKTLFATHYHELTELEGVLTGVKNYRISIKELSGNIIFLRKIVRGGANKSFGIEVASLAGLPSSVLGRARTISHNLEETDLNKQLSLTAKINSNTSELEKVNKNTNEILRILKDVDMNRTSPLDAFDMLTSLEKLAKGEK